MAHWGDLELAEPAFAERVRRRFQANRHSTLATLRDDGSPRISGIEVQFSEGEVVLGMMLGSLKARDLRNDPRFALHSPSEDPPDDVAEHDTWPGDAKLAGLAIEDPDIAQTPMPHNRFRLDLTEVVLIRVGTPPDHLVIELWSPDGGLTTRIRR